MLPCAGDAPMNLDVAPIYRDCAKPDFSKLKTEPLIVRPPAAK